MKSGRMSKEDLQYIADNVHTLPYTQIAREINRSADSVKKYIEKKLGLKTSLGVDTNPALRPDESSIRTTPMWASLEKQLTDKELQKFEYLWNKYYHEQFKGNILPTEESQLCDVIMLEILIDRNLEEQKSTIKDVMELELLIKAEQEKGSVEIMELDNLRRQIAIMRTGNTALMKDYRELLDKKNKGFGALKALRSERIKRVENSKESFNQWMAEIINSPEKRRELGIRMEKMRLAVIDEQVRLAAYHKYEDGTVDQPYLTAETVKEDNGGQNLLEGKGSEE